MVELVAGLEVHGQNAWPGVGFDLGAASGLLSPFLTAGFYYKTFIGPGRGTRFWMFFERFIRSAAGMGRASREPDPDQYDRANGFCDVLVVGSGPAGLAAAETAAAGGLQVWLVEQDFALGGSLLAESGRIEDRPAADWRAERMAALEASGQVRILSHTTAFGFYDGGVVGLYQHLPGSGEDGHRGRFWVLRAGRTILATGAHERGFAFAHNDRPGVDVGLRRPDLCQPLPGGAGPPRGGHDLQRFGLCGGAGSRDRRHQGGALRRPPGGGPRHR